MHYVLDWIKVSVKMQNIKKLLENWGKNAGKVGEFCQSGKVGTMSGILTFYLGLATALRGWFVHF